MGHPVTLQTPLYLALFFSGDINEDQPLVNVNDYNRDDLIDVIDGLEIKGGTCLYDGLMQGMDVSLNSYRVTHIKI